MCRTNEPTREWREFEKLIARIEADADRLGAKVTSPDRLRCNITGQMREVDVLIRSTGPGAPPLTTIECRRRSRIQDVTWIEQLATKKQSLGIDRTIAVSSSGFSETACAIAQNYGVELKTLNDAETQDLNQFVKMDFVLFWHRKALIWKVGVRKFRRADWKLPSPDAVDFEIDVLGDFHKPIFRNRDTNRRWSINDLWLQVQEACDPFVGVPKLQPPIARTACFPYPGNVTVIHNEDEVLIGDVLLSVGLQVVAEQVTLEQAAKVKYEARNAEAIDRVEFNSSDPKDRRMISLQAPTKTDRVDGLTCGFISDDSY